ncbi:Lyzozyme M1 (1,4-beta-N-acetylmuramidase), GH25 family [Actinopolyspora xinjiangensis]|uniref:Lyzozyme M1 (1,4-beta-N-acetylmuramidase), GH25 family n=1 Tax=Actinopolyspora xinjiangensis TaxID=405564 RepID=A0A1H0U3W3_9ACTN|nr:glycoside hydrolase family 25 protein [Actinopolyspora xinjiangensis]SDP60526.1 Lyzozyme M1 (1,4-beta-N-acetylmuramidase), GH25 family [Actinopolyspora xinjiangensis]
MIYGIDVSHYQGSFDMRRARSEAFEFVFIKATEGSGFVDPRFRENLTNARAAGLLVAAYHYQREGVDAHAQADHIASVVPADCPVILDVESGGGGVSLAREVMKALHRRGYRTPLLYLPEWYWRELGRPDLSDFPPLWKSRYPDTNGGYASEIYQRVPGHFWSDYGGNAVAVLQFTSSATIAGSTPVDANAYRSDRHDLAELLGGNTTQEADMRDDERAALFGILKELTGSETPGEYPGWESLVNPEKSFTMLDYVRYIDRHTYAGRGLDRDSIRDVVREELGPNGTLRPTLRDVLAEHVPASVSAEALLDELANRLAPDSE